MFIGLLFILLSSNLIASNTSELDRLQRFISESRMSKSSGKGIEELLSKRKTRIESRRASNKEFSYDMHFFGIVNEPEIIRLFFISDSAECTPVSGTVSHFGDSSHTLLSSTCGLNGCDCHADILFSPLSAGTTASTFCFTAGDDTECANFYGHGYYTYDLLEESESACGSIINIDSKSVAEVIPVVGAPFNLVYTSNNAERYSAPYTRPVLKDSYNPENLSVSIVHWYDKQNNRLFKGDGTVLSRKHTIIARGYSVVIDGEDVFTFDASGKHLFTRSKLTGYIKFSFDYDDANKLIKVTDAFGKETTFSRDTNGILQTIISPYGETTSVAVNTKGVITAVTTPANETFTLKYHENNGTLSKFGKPNGNETTFRFNSNGWLDKDTGPGGNFWNFDYSVDGEQFIIDRSSAMERYHTYIYRKNPVTNRQERQFFGPAGFETFYTEGADKSSYYEDVYESRASMTTEDERFGDLLNRTSSESKTINGLTREIVHSQTAVLNNPDDFFSYNQIVRTTSINGKQSTHVFDKNLMTHTYTDEVGVQRKIQIDLFERPIQIQHAEDVPMSISYNTDGLVSEITQNGTNTIKYTYNSKGRVANTRNALNEITRYAYDNAGRVTRITLPDGRFTRFVYNKNGQILRVVPAGRPAHSFVYNLMELPSVYRPPLAADASVAQTRYSYDQDKTLTMIRRPDNKVVRFNYEPEMGQLMAMVLGPNERQTYSYYEYTDNVRAVNSPDGVRSSFTYFGKDRIASELQTIDNVSTRVRFTFDNFFRPVRRILQKDGNEISRIGMVYKDDSKPSRIGDMLLTYDQVSGRLVSTILDKVRDRRTYDSFGNLESYRATYHPENAPAQELYFYTLTRDALHRIVTKIERVQGVRTDYAYSYDSVGRLSSVTKNGVIVSSFTYDSNSNRVSGTQDGQPFTATFDDQDRMLTYTWGSEDPKQFTYNANGELIQIVQGSNTTTFNPDSLGRLKSVTLPTSDVISYKLDWDGKRAARFVNGTLYKRSIYENKFQLAGELDSSNTFTEYVSATNINSSDYIKKNGELYRIFKDHLGSPRLVVKAADGSVAQKMSYNEWGKVIEDTNPGFQPFGFAGGLYDNDTKLVKFGARDYDASIGRWLSKDPTLFAGRDTNLYGYVLQDPINLIDPTGLIFSNIVGGVLAGTYTAVTGGSAGEVALSAALGFATSGWSLVPQIGLEYLMSTQQIDPSSSQPGRPTAQPLPVTLPNGPFLPNPPQSNSNACSYSGPTISGR